MTVIAIDVANVRKKHYICTLICFTIDIKNMRHILMAIAMTIALMAPAQVVDEIYGNDVDLTIITPAQQDKSDKPTQKQRKKQLQQRVDSVGHARALAALERGYWVVVADRINVGSTGYTVSGLNGNSNFVFQQAQEGMVQFAFNHGMPSMNGLGGMSLEGKVKNERARTDKKGKVTYDYDIFGLDIDAHVTVYLDGGSDYAEVVVQPAISGPRLTYHGRLVPYIRPRKD